MRRRTPIPIWLVVAASVFLFGLGTLLISSIAREAPPGFPISDLEPRPEPDGLFIEPRLTVDARSADRWSGLDFSTGAVFPVAEGPAAWDLALRRFRLVINGGKSFLGRAGVLAMPGIAFDEVTEAPETGYAMSAVSPGGDTVNAALEDWYEYGFFSHLLEPRQAVYVVRTADGKYAKFEILGYYCPGAEPGCVTLRYAYQGDGSQRLVP